MFDTSDISAFKGVVGWDAHHNTDISVNAANSASSSGRFFQDFHPANRVDLIKATIPNDKDINEHLDELIDQGVRNLLTQLRQKRTFDKIGKSFLANDTIYSKYGHASQTILNQSRFVGFCLEPKLEIGIKAVINRIAFHAINDVANLDIYVFHSSCPTPIDTITVSSTAGKATWSDSGYALYSEKEFIGGEYYIGYYQDDLATQAINYDQFDWSNGPCNGCDNGVRKTAWRKLTRYFGISSFYVENPTVGQLFEKSEMTYINNYTWGLNMNLSMECDLTYFIAQHKHLMDEAIGLAVTEKNLSNIKYSQQKNFVEENLKMMSIRDLEGDKDTNMLNIPQRLSKAIDNISFDFGSQSHPCLPCADNAPGVTFSQA